MNAKRLAIITILGLLALNLLILIPTVKANPNYEDFMDYTEVDPSNRLNYTHHSIDFKAVSNEDAYLYRDKGINHFSGDFKHKIDVKLVSHEDYGEVYFWALTNGVDDRFGLIQADVDFIDVGFNYVHIETTWKMHLFERYDGSTEKETISVSLGTWYYLMIERKSYEFTAKIYINATNRDIEGTPVGTLSLTLNAIVSYRYIFASLTENIDLENQIATITVENLDLKWHMVETWNFNLGRGWNHVETWNFNLQTPTWHMVESWNFNLQTPPPPPPTWHFVESWNFNLNATSGVLIWNHVETWMFNLEVSPDWWQAETWAFNLNAIADWYYVESWDFNLHVLFLPEVRWHLVESWCFRFGKPFDSFVWITSRTLTWMGMAGIAMMIVTPLLVVIFLKSKEYEYASIIALMGFALGFCMMVAWLWG